LIQIFDASNAENPKKVAQINAHSGPVWQITWAHPKYGSVIASCGYDGKVNVWKEVKPNEWERVFEFAHHVASVNSIQWAPWEYGLILASASSDGTISIMTYGSDENWSTKRFQAHNVGVNSVSWGPATFPALLQSEVTNSSLGLPPKRIVTGGSDKLVKVWVYNDANDSWNEEKLKEVHSDWVRDVAWGSNLGSTYETIASCSEDQSVYIWRKGKEGDWESTLIVKLSAPVWRVSWSPTGNMLSVAAGDNVVTIYKETLQGSWEVVAKIGEGGTVEAGNNEE